MAQTTSMMMQLADGLRGFRFNRFCPRGCELCGLASELTMGTTGITTLRLSIGCNHITFGILILERELVTLNVGKNTPDSLLRLITYKIDDMLAQGISSQARRMGHETIEASERRRMDEEFHRGNFGSTLPDFLTLNEQRVRSGLPPIDSSSQLRDQNRELTRRIQQAPPPPAPRKPPEPHARFKSLEVGKAEPEKKDLKMSTERFKSVEEEMRGKK